MPVYLSVELTVDEVSPVRQAHVGVLNQKLLVCEEVLGLPGHQALDSSFLERFLKVSEPHRLLSDEAVVDVEQVGDPQWRVWVRLPLALGCSLDVELSYLVGLLPGEHDAGLAYFS